MMRRTWTTWIIDALGTALLAALVVGLFITYGRHLDAERVPADCVEDRPCWDCNSMGNGPCGPLTAPATSWDGAPITLVETYYSNGRPTWTYTRYEDGAQWIDCHSEECHNAGHVQ